MGPITKVLTERGYRSFFILLGCTGLAALFVDPFLAILALGLAGFVFYDYRKANNVAGKISNLLKINSNNLKVISVAGQSKTITLSCQTDIDLPANLSPSLKEATLKPSQLKKGKFNLELLLSSEISGNYTSDKIKVEVFGPYRLTKKEGNIPFNLEFKVFPRVMVALIQAALFLLRGGRGGRGEVPISFKGPGTEYADTREYVPGDTLHHMDWKATARYGKLMVKEFFQEAGQGAHIIYDTRATGPASQDKLATNFLNTCLGIAEQGYPAGVTVHDGREVLLHSTQESFRQVLKMAMGYVLQSMRVELEGIDTLVDPASSFQIRRFLHKVQDEQVKKFLEFEAEVLQDRLGEPYKFLVRLSRQMSEERQFLLISQLSGELVDTLQLADEIRRHHQLTIVQPTEPWREAKNLEEAYRWHERQRKVEGILARHRVRVVKQVGG